MPTEDSPPSPHILFPHWQNEYAAALLEFDPLKLQELVEAAETAIYKRLQQLSHNSEHSAERQAIEDAPKRLRVLKREALSFPDWEKK
jgi:hypothetical protein